MAQAHCRTSFVQLLHGDAKDAERSLRKLLKKTAGRVATVSDGSGRSDTPGEREIEADMGDRFPPVHNGRLQMAETGVYGTRNRALL